MGDEIDRYAELAGKLAAEIDGDPARLAARLIDNDVAGTHDRTNGDAEPELAGRGQLLLRRRVVGASGSGREHQRRRPALDTEAFSPEPPDNLILDGTRRSIPVASRLGQGDRDVHILITGAAGMIGRKLTERLAKDGGLNGRPID